MSEQNNGNQRSSSRDYFKLITTARLTADPEMRYTPNGKAVTNMRMAINIPVWDSATGGIIDGTMWVRGAVWDNQAEICNRFLTKGSKVLIESEKPTFKPETGDPPVFNRQDGSAGSSFEFTLNRVAFLGGGQRQEAQAEVVAEPQGEEVIF
jgi:single-strand DNA-binding protein